MTKIRLSVIVPTFNTSADLLENCLESLYQQDFISVEFLILDDGSTEDWIEPIVRNYVSKDARFRYIRKENSGVADTRNQGIGISQGEYIMFVDSDDQLMPNACDYAVKRIESVGSDVIIMGIQDVHASDVNFQKMLNENEKTTMMYSVMAMTSIYEDWHIKIDSPWAKIFKSSIIKKNNIQFPCQLQRSEDAIFCLLYYNICQQIYIDSHPIYDYVGNPESICRKCSTISIDALPLVLKEEERFLEENPKLRSMYNSALFERTFEGIQESLCTYFFNRKNPKNIKTLAQELQNFVEGPVVYQYFKGYGMENLRKKRLRKKIYWSFLKLKWYRPLFYFERIMHPAWIFK